LFNTLPEPTSNTKEITDIFRCDLGHFLEALILEAGELAKGFQEIRGLRYLSLIFDGGVGFDEDVVDRCVPDRGLMRRAIGKGRGGGDHIALGDDAVEDVQGSTVPVEDRLPCSCLAHHAVRPLMRVPAMQNDRFVSPGRDFQNPCKNLLLDLLFHSQAIIEPNFSEGNT